MTPKTTAGALSASGLRGPATPRWHQPGAQLTGNRVTAATWPPTMNGWTPQRARQHLADTAAIWSVDPSGATDVIDAACAWLLAGLDTPTLRILPATSHPGRTASSPTRALPAAELINLDNAYEYVDAIHEGHRQPSNEVEAIDAAVTAEARRLISDDPAGSS